MILTDVSTLIPYVIIGVLAVIIVGIIVAYFIKSKKDNKKDEKKEDAKIIIKDNVRYNDEKDTVSELKFTEHDLVLKQGTSYIVSKSGPVLPGKYVMYPGTEGSKEYKVRLQGFVRVHHSGEEIVLAEGEEISPVSENIILK